MVEGGLGYNVCCLPKTSLSHQIKSYGTKLFCQSDNTRNVVARQRFSFLTITNT